MPEEEDQEEEDVEEQPPEESEETSPEAPEESEESDDSEDVDYKERLEQERERDSDPTEDYEKSRKALYYNAKDFVDRGGDPHEVLEELGITEEEADDIQEAQQREEPQEVERIVEKKMAKEKAREMTESQDEYELVMYYVNQRNLSLEDAYYLANKGKLTRQGKEQERAQRTQPKKKAGTRRRQPKSNVPNLPDEAVRVLENRGLEWSAEHQEYRGQHTRMYWDDDEGAWITEKI